MAVRLCILFVQIMLEIAVSHWPFSNQFLDLADQNRYVRTNLLSSEMFLFSINGRPISNPISSTNHRKNAKHSNRAVIWPIHLGTSR